MATTTPAKAAPANPLEVSKKPLSEVVKDLPTRDNEAPSLSSLSPKTAAIYKVDSPLSQVYTHLHTPLLLSLFALKFGALVESPVATLAVTAPILAALQAAYCGICLQPSTVGSGKKNKRRKKLAVPAGAPARPVTPVKAHVASTYNIPVIGVVSTPLPFSLSDVC